MQGLNLPCPRSLGWTGEQIKCQHILVSRFTFTPHGDLVWLLLPSVIALVGSANKEVVTYKNYKSVTIATQGFM